MRVSVAKHSLTPEQRATYDAAAALWQDLGRVHRARASRLPPSSGSRFWSAPMSKNKAHLADQLHAADWPEMAEALRLLRV